MYGTTADIQRALTEVPAVDESAAREWMQGGARLEIPTPAFAWRLYRADGSVLELDPETAQWVPVDDS